MYKDFILNIIGSAILTIATQLFAYPYLGRMLTAQEYGTMLTAMALANTIGASLGGSLNNARILLQADYEREGVTGDFNRIVTMLAIPSAAVSLAVVSFLYGGLTSFAAGTAAISVLVLMRSYYMVAFRVVINYRRVVVANCIGFAGYMTGIGIAHITGWWPAVFILGEVAVLLYLTKASDIFKEGLGKTALFSQAVSKFGILLSATAIGQAMSYMDRFLIYPVLGAEQVSVFTVASLLGKTVGIIASPIAGVLLTYYAKEDSRLTAKVFRRRVLVCTALCVTSYVAVMIVSKPALKLLYPDFVELAAPYLPISNAGAVLLILGNLIQPSLLKSADNRWQPVIQLVHLLTYVTLCLYLTATNGLNGFCLGVLAANVIRFALMLLVMYATLRGVLE